MTGHILPQKENKNEEKKKLYIANTGHIFVRFTKHVLMENNNAFLSWVTQKTNLSQIWM